MPTRSLALAVIVIVLGMMSTAMTMSPAWAEPAYRYWSYWTADSAGWAFAQQGPATRRAVDGTAEAWSFGVSSAAGSPELAPTVSPADAFSQGCGTTPSRPGAIRVAIIADDGDQVAVRCAVVDEGASSAQALSSVFDLRIEDGLVCAIDGSPASGCAEQVDTDVATDATNARASGATPTDAEDARSVGFAASPWTALAVIVVIAAGVVIARRRRS